MKLEHQTLSRHYLQQVPPCDDCGEYENCKHNKVACFAFRMYASEKKKYPPSTPSRVIYDIIYSEEDDE